MCNNVEVVPSKVDDDEQTFVPLVYDQRYEISTTEPWNFRRIGKSSCLKQCVSNSGYLLVGVCSNQLVHRLVALQFIPNDDAEVNTVVHHKDGNKLNNALSNLEWTTPSRNRKLAKSKTKQSDEYLDDLPPNVIEITEYTNLELDGYYFDIDDERILKVQNNGKIKIIKPTVNGEILEVKLIDINKKSNGRSYKKLIRTMKELVST